MRARARRRGPRTAGPSLSGLLAGLAVLGLAIVLLFQHSTVTEVGRFVLFTGLGIALPGFALWRLVGSYGRLAANDAAFTAPNPAAIERLRKVGVRWLYADNRAGKVSPALRNYVRLRHATLDATIYEIR
ncbi:hypothetical protein ACIBL3_05980 [Kribbella sp. NPDC050124]|uniref:hypothetical protein n=1 Tax=Kribbella sp. NPDC050124 TaxID=3364114 RepID=UPI003797A87B